MFPFHRCPVFLRPVGCKSAKLERSLALGKICIAAIVLSVQKCFSSLSVFLILGAKVAEISLTAMSYLVYCIVCFSCLSQKNLKIFQIGHYFLWKFPNFAFKMDTQMRQEEISLQALTTNEAVHVGYSDDDIVIVDSIQQFTNVREAHVQMCSIVICTSGRLQGLINGQPIELRQNHVAVIPANVVITDLMISPDFNIKAMFFTNQILQSFLREKMNIWNEVMYIQRMHVISLTDDDIRFYTCFYDMLSLCFEKDADTPFRSDVIQSLVRSAMLGLCGAMKQQLTGSNHLPLEVRTSNGHFQRFLDLLHSTEVKHRTVESYASDLCLSPKYLSFICKKQSGKTANEWITEQVTEDIRYHLKQTDLTISQVADRLGFPNPSFFGRYVKAHFGMTPVQFREQQLYKED